MRDDPYRLDSARFGKCARCGTPLKGKPAIYWPRLRRAFCLACGEDEYRSARALIREEDTGMPC